MLFVALVMLLIALGFFAAAYFFYLDENTGPEASASISSCSGTDTRFGSGITCQGTWVVGGALVGGNGHVVGGNVIDADYSDIGHTISVHLHGDNAYPTKDSLRVPIGFFVFGLIALYPAVRLSVAAVRGGPGRGTV